MSSRKTFSQVSQSSFKRQEVLDLNNVIDQLIASNLKDLPLSDATLEAVIWAARTILEKQPMLLELTGPLNICGDVHGQFTDLLRLFEMGGFPPESNYLFLGDYVDRGRNSIQTIALLLAYKAKYPNNFFLLRGNHQSACINRHYGFYDECTRRGSPRLWRLFGECFNYLPVAATIQGQLLCMHGGISPMLKSLSQINELERPTQVPPEGLLCDLLWSDPMEGSSFAPNEERGVSFTFGQKQLRKVLQSLALLVIVRAHQVVEDGYQFFDERRLVTIFSAPNYCGQFENKAAMMRVSRELECSFLLLKAETTRKGGSRSSRSLPRYE